MLAGIRIMCLCWVEIINAFSKSNPTWGTLAPFQNRACYFPFPHLNRNFKGYRLHCELDLSSYHDTFRSLLCMVNLYMTGEYNTLYMNVEMNIMKFLGQKSEGKNRKHALEMNPWWFTILSHSWLHICPCLIMSLGVETNY